MESPLYHSTDQLARKWGEILEERLVKALDKYNIGTTSRELMQSITTQIIAHNGDAEKVLLKFLQRGRFVDMRVGRAVPLGATNNKRRKKPWFSKTYYSQSQQLSQLFIRHFNQLMMPQISETFSGDITMNM